MERAKQKALELIELFNGFDGIGEETAKKCALICVNEVLYEASRITEEYNFYWDWVKKEIEERQNHLQSLPDPSENKQQRGLASM